jgi:hypothetical protein
VSTTPPPAGSVARRLLDAQVAYHLDRVSPEHLEDTVAGLADSVLSAAGGRKISDLVDREAVTTAVARSLQTVPGSAAVDGIIALVIEVVLDGPPEPYPIGELVDRQRFEVLLDRLLELNPLLEQALERLTASPLVGTIATRFMSRVVGEVLQANKAVADRVPGLGQLMSFGTTTASRMMGAADKQLDGLLGDAVGKGGTFAVRRLNKILIETLRDPTTRAAVLEVWDLVSEAPVEGLSPRVSRDDITPVVDAAHALTVSTLANEHVADLVSAVVDGFLERFGSRTPTELLLELGISRDDLVADLVRLAPVAVGALRESGDLERIVRERLEPFYSSPAVTALLDGP